MCEGLIGFGWRGEEWGHPYCVCQSSSTGSMRLHVVCHWKDWWSLWHRKRTTMRKSKMIMSVSERQHRKIKGSDVRQRTWHIIKKTSQFSLRYGSRNMLPFLSNRLQLTHSPAEWCPCSVKANSWLVTASCCCADVPTWNISATIISAD